VTLDDKTDAAARPGGAAPDMLRQRIETALGKRVAAPSAAAPPPATAPVKRVVASPAPKAKTVAGARVSAPSASRGLGAALASPSGWRGALRRLTRRLAAKLGLRSDSDAELPSDAPELPAAVYLSSLFINLMGLALPMVMLQVYDRILPNQATETLLMLVLGMAGVMILDTAMKIARAYMVGWVTARHQFAVMTDAIERILNAPSALMERDPPSVHLDSISALDTMREFYGGQSRLLLLDLPFVFIFLGLIGFIGGPLILVPLAVIAVLGYISIQRGVELRKVLEIRASHDDRRYDFIIESLLGIHTIKSMAMEPQLQRRFERLQRVGAAASHDTIFLGNQAQIVGNLFSNLTMIGVVTVGAYMVIQGNLTMGTLAACSLLAGRTVQPLLRGLGLWTQIQTISIARSRIDGLFELPPATPETQSIPDNPEGRIDITDMSYAYGPDKPFVLKDLNLNIAAGEIIGLRGGDGSGKSTLIQLLRGELTPMTGQVRIDGHDAAGALRPAIADWMATAPQKVSLFRGTILDNITMFRTGPMIDQAREACRLIGLEDDIHRLASGYDTPVSEGITDELPAGMMQRIVIARALARKPKILLFDEGNSSLDARSDRLLREGLIALKGTMTVLLVTQRPSLLRIADRIFALEKGQLRDAMADYVEPTHAQPATAPAAIAEQVAS